MCLHEHFKDEKYFLVFSLAPSLFFVVLCGASISVGGLMFRNTYLWLVFGLDVYTMAVF